MPISTRIGMRALAAARRAAWPVPALLALVAWPNGARAGMPAASCIRGAAVVPLLGGRGDSPIIPIGVNGRAAAAYVSPAFRHVFIHDYGPIWFPAGPTQPLTAQDGHIVNSRPTEIDDLTIGPVDVASVAATLLDGPAQHMVGGRPILGVLGRDLFSRVDVLLDMPHRTLALFTWSGARSCGDDPARIFSGDVYALPMDDGGAVHARIGQTVARLELDPDLGTSVLPASEARDAGVSDASLAADPRITTQYASIVMGYKHEFKGVMLGSYAVPAFDFIVQRDIRDGALGQNFFEGVVALLDFPHGRLVFQPTADRDSTAPLHLHFDMPRQGTASVREGAGHIDDSAAPSRH